MGLAIRVESLLALVVGRRQGVGPSENLLGFEGSSFRELTGCGHLDGALAFGIGDGKNQVQLWLVSGNGPFVRHLRLTSSSDRCFVSGNKR